MSETREKTLGTMAPQFRVVVASLFLSWNTACDPASPNQNSMQKRQGGVPSGTPLDAEPDAESEGAVDSGGQDEAPVSSSAAAQELQSLLSAGEAASAAGSPAPLVESDLERAADLLTILRAPMHSDGEGQNFSALEARYDALSHEP